MIKTVKLRNGIALEYSDRGKGEAILLLHGLGSTKADWDKQVGPLSKDFRVIAPDLRGHGNSSKPPARGDYGIPLCADDMHLLLEELKIDRCAVAGFSMGGAVAFEMAVRHPAIVTRMIMINTAPDFNKLGWLGKKMVIERTISLKLSGMEPLARKVSSGMFPDEEQENLRDTFYERAKANDVNAYYHSFRTLMKWGIGQMINAIDIPVLVIASDMDYTPVSLKQAYASKMENAKVEVVKNSRHGVTMDQPEELNKIILKFLKE